MVNEILQNAGYILNETYKESRFITPPKKQTYAVYSDNIERGGGDQVAGLKLHNIQIELYEYTPDKPAEERIETQLDAAHEKMVYSWSKEARYWLESESLYQVIYEFSYYEKI